VFVILFAALPMVGLSNMQGTTWVYGQPFPFLSFYDSGGWSLWPQAWFFRIVMNFVFWSVLLGTLALVCSRLHARFGEEFSSHRAFFGFLFGVGVCLAQVICPMVYELAQWLGFQLPAACVPTLIVGTLFGHAFGFDVSLTAIGTALVLFGCVLPWSLVFARGFKVFRPWSGLAIAAWALLSFSCAAARWFSGDAPGRVGGELTAGVFFGGLGLLVGLGFRASGGDRELPNQALQPTRPRLDVTYDP
jgi:hypothetical protein